MDTLRSPMAPRAGLQAASDAQRLELPLIVERLRDLLGARLVAYIGGVKETRAVREWIQGIREPGSEAVRQRLRDAYQVSGLLAEVEEPAVIQTWFMGMNPQLGDRAPARLLRDGDEPNSAPAVLAAARAFIASA